jgi:hypothetical protein
MCGQVFRPDPSLKSRHLTNVSTSKCHWAKVVNLWIVRSEDLTAQLWMLSMQTQTYESNFELPQSQQGALFLLSPSFALFIWLLWPARPVYWTKSEYVDVKTKYTPAISPNTVSTRSKALIKLIRLLFCSNSQMKVAVSPTPATKLTYSILSVIYLWANENLLVVADRN